MAKKQRQILNARYKNLYRLKDQVPDFLFQIKDKITAILHALDECANRLNAIFPRFFDELAEKHNRAIRQKFELAYERVPNSTAPYKQVKQEPSVFRVLEDSQGLWLNTKESISAYDQFSGTFDSYLQEDTEWLVENKPEF